MKAKLEFDIQKYNYSVTLRRSNTTTNSKTNLKTMFSRFPRLRASFARGQRLELDKFKLKTKFKIIQDAHRRLSTNASKSKSTTFASSSSTKRLLWQRMGVLGVAGVSSVALAGLGYHSFVSAYKDSTNELKSAPEFKNIYEPTAAELLEWRSWIESPVHQTAFETLPEAEQKEVDYYVTVIRTLAYIARTEKTRSHSDEPTVADILKYLVVDCYGGPNPYHGIIKATNPPSIGIGWAYSMSEMLTPLGKFSLGRSHIYGTQETINIDARIVSRLKLKQTVGGVHIENYGQVGPFYSVGEQIDPHSSITLGEIAGAPLRLYDRDFVYAWWRSHRDMIFHRAFLNLDQLTRHNLSISNKQQFETKVGGGTDAHVHQIPQTFVPATQIPLPVASFGCTVSQLDKRNDPTRLFCFCDKPNLGKWLENGFKYNAEKLDKVAGDLTGKCLSEEQLYEFSYKLAQYRVDTVCSPERLVTSHGKMSCGMMRENHLLLANALNLALTLNAVQTS